MPDMVQWGGKEIPRLARLTSRDDPWPVSYVSHMYATAVEGWPASWIVGQINQIDIRRANLCYITLKDEFEENTVQLVGYSAFSKKVRDLGLRQGEKIVVRGRPNVWERATRLSVVCDEVFREGQGNLVLQIEQLKRKLKGEGLFDQERKRPLPEFPRRIGLICAPDSQAEGDVVKNARLRWPVEFTMAYAHMQGVKCPQEVADAIRKLDADPEVDVIIVARGGGSFEDLIGFSDEGVVRAAAACVKPIVSAIGHENDWTLIELAVDYRATTPTGAAIAVTPSCEEQSRAIADNRRRVNEYIDRVYRENEIALRGYLNNPLLTNPESMVDRPMERLEHIRERIIGQMERFVAFEDPDIEGQRSTLTALSPQSTLNRGYAVVQGDDGHVITDPDEIDDGASVTIRVRRGIIGARKTEGCRME
ncbi:MAG: exodeoxyribonuclease VII large subunit [Bifidobacteriaceae bacterium]|nr:exodeoxyribonuclease VII large subunit [Bifidobacteriaceae bacterium]